MLTERSLGIAVVIGCAVLIIATVVIGRAILILAIVD